VTGALGQICAAKREHVAACRANRPLGAAAGRAARGAAAARLRPRPARRGGRRPPGPDRRDQATQPQPGLIRADFHPPTLARAYAAGGAACLSVLTDGPYFGGELGHLVAARGSVCLPVLRKDFILDPFQVVEARAAGADAVLLIMAALDTAQAEELEAAAHGLGLDVLVEVHGEAELERALRLRTPLIGINNRDLWSLTVDLATTERLAPLMPADRLPVCESGITSPDDLARMGDTGVRCFLVGESLMRQADVAMATATLLGKVPA
jgi:indole-3-glycerol phosphate synthase